MDPSSRLHEQERMKRWPLGCCELLGIVPVDQFTAIDDLDRQARMNTTLESDLPNRWLSISYHQSIYYYANLLGVIQASEKSFANRSTSPGLLAAMFSASNGSASRSYSSLRSENPSTNL